MIHSREPVVVVVGVGGGGGDVGDYLERVREIVPKKLLK